MLFIPNRFTCPPYRRTTPSEGEKGEIIPVCGGLKKIFYDIVFC